jgi:hypothetical protein
MRHSIGMIGRRKLISKRKPIRHFTNQSGVRSNFAFIGRQQSDHPVKRDRQTGSVTNSDGLFFFVWNSGFETCRNNKFLRTILTA